jgi:hypothetical protein
MTDPIGRPLGEEHGLIDVGGEGLPPDVLTKDAAAQEDDLMAVGVFLGRRTAGPPRQARQL